MIVAQTSERREWYGIARTIQNKKIQEVDDENFNY